ncbi:SH3-domain-containing protein [Butyriboletus roseoflavus]|nr:SH3-domain-containing protein [Butyriboletus roseoflavus]
MSVPHELQTAALLGHVATQMQLNVAFLESQNYLSPQDAAIMKEIIGRLPVQTQTSITTTTQVRVVGAPAPSGRVVPPPSRPMAAMPSIGAPVYARAIWSYNEDGAEANDLSFAAGETVEIVTEKNEDWWLGKARGKEGLFPSNYVEKVESAGAVIAASTTGRSYRPFGAALHGTDTPPPNGGGVNSIGLQQASGQAEKKSKYGSFGNTVIAERTRKVISADQRADGALCCWRCWLWCWLSSEEWSSWIMDIQVVLKA